MESIAGFEWDQGNRTKCQRHGVSVGEIESLFLDDAVTVRLDLTHSAAEERYAAVGRNRDGRSVFLVFTLRRRDGAAYLRPISARYMHEKEIRRYGKDNPDLQN